MALSCCTQVGEEDLVASSVWILTPNQYPPPYLAAGCEGWGVGGKMNPGDTAWYQMLEMKTN